LIVAGSGVVLGAVLDLEVDGRLGCSCGISSQQEDTAQRALDRKHDVCCDCEINESVVVEVKCRKRQEK